VDNLELIGILSLLLFFMSFVSVLFWKRTRWIKSFRYDKW